MPIGVATVSFQANFNDAWVSAWLDSIVDRPGALSHRAWTKIEKHGGIEPVIAAATHRNIHLVEMIDESGQRVVAASRSPVRPIC